MFVPLLERREIVVLSEPEPSWFVPGGHAVDLVQGRGWSEKSSNFSVVFGGSPLLFFTQTLSLGLFLRESVQPVHDATHVGLGPAEEVEDCRGLL